MLVFRSEGEVERWCAWRGRAQGAVFAPETLWLLARAWYADRLDPGWVRRSVAERQAILEGVGLTGPFWAIEGGP